MAHSMPMLSIDEDIPDGPLLPENLTNSDDIIVTETYYATTRWDDATWILTSAFIIFTMQSGFGLLESGSVSQKNEVNIMVKNAVDVLFGGLSYWMVGYGLSFGMDKGTNGFIGVGDFLLDETDGDDTLGHSFAHFFFHASFATTATTIVSGAMAERTRLEAYIVFSFVNTFIYVFPAHWMWASNGWLKQLGALDIAGSGSVHLVGGVTGLVATLIMKPRAGRFRDGINEIPAMGSPTNAIFGMFMLWWGWLGFNCGSTYGITNNKWILAARSAVTTITSSVGGGIAGITLSYLTKQRKVDVTYMINGVLGALVSICALCAIARPWEGLVIGIIGGLLACGGSCLTEKLRIDDPVGVVPVHGVCGMWGMLTVGLFGAVDELEEFELYNGLFAGGGFKLLGIQALAVVCIASWTAFWSFICFNLLNITIGLRVPLHEEILGADIVEHSLNGTFDRKTGEWKDFNGKLLMIVKKNQPLKYYDTVLELLANLYRGSSNTDDATVLRKSAFGFSRVPDIEGDKLMIETIMELEAKEERRRTSTYSSEENGRKSHRRLFGRKKKQYTVNDVKNSVSARENFGMTLHDDNDAETTGVYSIRDARNNRGVGSSPIDG
ncbi:putative ammonium transporter 2 [Amphiura filiformis]|uniref:putative ammonium transporter 2 n=1 Tax=Amphiura filiformis TaxID=82378 RepID=UPI003B2107D6